MKLLNYGITLLVVTATAVVIFLSAYFRRKYKKQLHVQTIDLLIAGILLGSFLLLSGHIKTFKVAGVIEAETDKAVERIELKEKAVIEEIKEQQQIAMLWLDVLKAETSHNDEAAVDYLGQILRKQKDSDTYGHLGWAYERLAEKYQEGENKKELFEKSLNAYLHANKIEPFSLVDNVANIYAALDQEDKCKEWLQKASEADQLSTYDGILTLEYINKYRNKPWFKELKWKKFE